MGENIDENRGKHQHQEDYAASPSTQQMRTVGQRRRDAEEKLEQHLQEARHKDDHHDDHASNEEETGPVDSGDVAAIQNDDRLTAADRVDLIANQVIPSDEEGGPAPEHDNKA